MLAEYHFVSNVGYDNTHLGICDGARSSAVGSHSRGGAPDFM